MFFDPNLEENYPIIIIFKKHMDIFSTNLVEKTHDNQHVFFHIISMKNKHLDEILFEPNFFITNYGGLEGKF